MLKNLYAEKFVNRSLVVIRSFYYPELERLRDFTESLDPIVSFFFNLTSWH